MGLFGRPQAYKYYPNIGFNGIDVSGILILDYGTFKAVCCGAKDSNSKAGCTIQGVKGYLNVDSMPGQVQNLSLIFNGQVPQVIGENLDDIMVNEFIKIDKIVASKNYTLCYEYLNQTYDVMDVVEKAREEAGVIFPRS